MKGFGCRPGASGRPGKEAGVRKPPKNEPAGTAVSGWPMGILRGSGFGEGWFFRDRREVKAADDCGPAAAAVVEGLIVDQTEMPGRRLQAPG